jgi:hypothetical protein
MVKKLAQINLMVSILKQGNRYIVYSPALDLSTSGKSQDQARKRFAEAALLLIEELGRAGTVHDVLTELGWRQERKQWEPPAVSQEGLSLRVPIAA